MDIDKLQGIRTKKKWYYNDLGEKLVMLSKVHSAIQNEEIDYSQFSEKLMKYIIQN